VFNDLDPDMYVDKANPQCDPLTLANQVLDLFLTIIAIFAGLSIT
jgi:hypothetical protein